MIMSDDIENNLDEIVIPDFTMEHIDLIDKYYNEQTYQLREPNTQCDSDDLEAMYVELHQNELISDHLCIVEHLRVKLYKYASIEIRQDNAPKSLEQLTAYKHLKIKKRLFYFQEIEPLLLEEQENLHEMVSLLSS
jgi:hypothetical protein